MGFKNGLNDIYLEEKGLLYMKKTYRKILMAPNKQLAI